jgi:hypothetical protein
MPCMLDRRCKPTLMLGAKTASITRNNLAAISNKLLQIRTIRIRWNALFLTEITIMRNCNYSSFFSYLFFHNSPVIPACLPADEAGPESKSLKRNIIRRNIFITRRRLRCRLFILFSLCCLMRPLPLIS